MELFLKEYRIFRDDEKESTQPAAAENSAKTLNVGDQLQLPAEVTVTILHKLVGLNLTLLSNGMQSLNMQRNMKEVLR